MGDEGFYAEDDALGLTVDRFRLGASNLDRATGADVAAVDVGASSGIVGHAMARLQRIGVALAQHMEDTAEKIDAAAGSYAEVDNDAAGRLVYEEHYEEETNYGPGNQQREHTESVPDGPLERAPVDERGPDRDGRALAPEVADDEASSNEWEPTGNEPGARSGGAKGDG